MELQEIIDEMREWLRWEEEAQEKRFFEGSVSFKELRNDGVLIHPVKIQNKTFGFSDQPILTVSFGFSEQVNYTYFNFGTPIAVFLQSSNEVCNGQLLSIENNRAEILLYAEDFPDWIDEKGIGLKRLPDSHSFKSMHGVLKRIQGGENRRLQKLFKIVHGLGEKEKNVEDSGEVNIENNLNFSQLKAVKNGLGSRDIQIIHGPPGTGKTTTIAVLIQALRQKGMRIIASAPSNAAVDHLAIRLLEMGMNVLRLGNTAKVNQKVWEHTPEGVLSKDVYSKSIKKLKIQAIEYRRLARQYKRSFGKSEREQRKLLFQEARAVRDEIKALTTYYLSQFYEKADVVLGTPIGLMDSLIKDQQFDVAFIDEAGQCIEPLAWLVMERANRVVLSGDYLQLPPTIISEKASNSGLAVSVLERAIQSGIPTDMLEVQYRMTPEIAGFSSRYFYQGKIQSIASSLPGSLVFYDTAGAGFLESRRGGKVSIANPDELNVIKNHYQKWIKPGQWAVFISPYSYQVEMAKSELSGIEISTIDSFQGQEADVVILSLVRGNTEGKIGFLSDYRRMNVALTRAKVKLVVIGDSSTLTHDHFYKTFVEYTEEIGAYKSVFELLYSE